AAPVDGRCDFMFTMPELKARRLPSQSQGHRCPHCGAGLWRNLPIVVATRNCPGCGRRVVEEPDHDNAPPPFTHQQIEAEQAAHARAPGRIGWVMATTFLA